MNKSILVWPALLFSSMIFIGCDDDKDEDTVAPIIKSTEINGKADELVVQAGNPMNIRVELEDNEDLGELKIDIHDVFDGHSHKSTSARWAEIKIIEVSGTEMTVSTQMNVPPDATAGPYHSTFRVLDAEGNEGDFVEFPFIISNGTEPMISINFPDFSNDAHVARGTTLAIVGEISDNVDLQEIIIHLEEAHEDHHHKSTMEEPLYEEDFDLTGSADLTWDFQADGNVNITIPANAEVGNYELLIRAEDNDGNIGIFEGEIHIM